MVAEEGESASKGLGAIEGAIFGLLGLILAFSFSGALTRFDARLHLVVEEANDIGTAWLRIALLPADAQPYMRDLFRRYLDSRIEAPLIYPGKRFRPGACRSAQEHEVARTISPEAPDRSWYNCAGVELVMGFCSKEEHQRFLQGCPSVEK